MGGRDATVWNGGYVAQRCQPRPDVFRRSQLCSGDRAATARLVDQSVLFHGCRNGSVHSRDYQHGVSHVQVRSSVLRSNI